ncbi:MAG: hypothetical protein MRJ68_18300 [Nitrospira sp.]|jgi:hypothetical protein|nr:hypothetical protein [Nitrospira sp.]
MQPIDLSDNGIQTQQVQQEREKAWPVAPPSRDELPDGVYVASFRNADRHEWFGQAKVRLRYEIIEPPAYAGIQVFLFSTLPKNLSHRHKYYELWVKANGGPPRRNDRMSPRIFKGYWRVKVTWSVAKSGGHPMPLVSELLERVAGR